MGWIVAVQCRKQRNKLVSRFKELVEESLARERASDPDCYFDIYDAIEEIIQTLPDYDRGYMTGRMEMLNGASVSGEDIFWDLERAMNRAINKAGL